MWRKEAVLVSVVCPEWLRGKRKITFRESHSNTIFLMIYPHIQSQWSKVLSLSLWFHSVDILDNSYEQATVVGVGGLIAFKRIMILNYPGFAIRRDINNFRLQEISTRYDHCDDTEVGSSEERSLKKWWLGWEIKTGETSEEMEGTGRDGRAVWLSESPGKTEKSKTKVLIYL